MDNIIGKATDLKTPCIVDTKRHDEYYLKCKENSDLSGMKLASAED